MFTMKNGTNQFMQYNQTGNICAFLNLETQQYDGNNSIWKINASSWEKDLAERFEALEFYGLHISNNSFLELLFPQFLRQFAVSRCSYEYQVATIESETYQNASVVREARGFVNPVLPEIILPSAVAMLAVLLNISLLIVTARKISMSTVCNWLLAFETFCQIPALLPFLVNLFALCARLDSVDSSVCLAFLMLSTGFFYASFLALFFISLERLLIVMMKRQINEKIVKRYSLRAVIICTLFGVVMVLNVFSAWITTNTTFGSCVYCNIGFQSEVLIMYYYISLAILGLTLLNYVLIACHIVWRRIYVPSSTQADSNDQMLRSAFIIFIVMSIGWLAGSMLLINITEKLRDSDNIAKALVADSEENKERFAFNVLNWAKGLTACLFPVAAAINAPVLIINNSDYRKAYKKTLASLLICRKRTSAATVSPIMREN